MSDFGFSKKLRLLGAADYQPVFKNARYKVSCQYILILAVASNVSRPRLGLVIAKKNIAKATERNRVKRIFRESFRHNQRLLPALDIVILARSGLGSLDNEQVHKNIERLWQELTNKTRRSSVTRDQANAG
ncbi:MAG: ribonuclease P protein component [Pseudomonadota bacterium]